MLLLACDPDESSKPSGSNTGGEQKPGGGDKPGGKPGNAATVNCQLKGTLSLTVGQKSTYPVNCAVQSGTLPDTVQFTVSFPQEIVPTFAIKDRTPTSQAAGIYVYSLSKAQFLAPIILEFTGAYKGQGTVRIETLKSTLEKDISVEPPTITGTRATLKTKTDITSFADMEDEGEMVVLGDSMHFIGSSNPRSDPNDVWSSRDGESWKGVGISLEAGGSPRPRLLFSAVSFDKKLFVIAGQLRSLLGGITNTNSVWESSNGTRWTSTVENSGFPERLSSVAVVFQNKIFVIGGYKDSSNVYSDVWSSSNGKDWTRVTTDGGFGARFYHGAVVFRNKIFIMGGATDSRTQFNDVWSSSDGQNWTQVTASANFEKRRSMIAVVHGGRIWLIGGKDSADNYNDFWSSADGETWEKQNVTLPSGHGNLAGRGGVVFGNKIYIVGGAKLITYQPH